MADALDRQFVDYLHQRDVATLVDDILAVVAEQQPQEPLSSILLAVSDRVRAKALALAADMPAGHSVGSAAQQTACMRAVTSLLDLYPSLPLLQQLERELCGDSESHPAAMHAAVKVAKARMVMRGLPALHLSVVVPLLNHARHACSADEREGADDAMRVKMRQLGWAFQERLQDCSWDMIAVDAGSTDGTVELMRSTIDKEVRDNVRLVRGVEGLSAEKAREAPPTVLLNAAALLGCQEAVQQQHPGKRHVVLLAEPSLSIDMAQVPLLLQPVTEGHPAAYASRFGSDLAVCCAVWDPRSEGSVPGVPRGTRLQLSLRALLRSKLLPPLAGVADAHAGALAVAADSLHAVLPRALPSRSHYASDLMLLLSLVHSTRPVLHPVPVCWVAPPAEVDRAAPSGPASDAADSRRAAAEAAHVAVAQLVEAHVAHSTALTGYLSATDADWGTFARRLSPDQFAALAAGLAAALELKDRLLLPEPTVTRLRLADAQALSRGESCGDDFPIHH
eukprot:TRINITY_DN47030_c0_g1_i1.p1 TRINITY_DN47030_c0_g1~~TRINITY_DN47030_c0_g1_i1.p1  ORF type:complete len:526 (+),score=235.06 TRINITY_DN47030_c0_g1_i1:58-1578(+)